MESYDFIQKLKRHKGGLISLTAELFWINRVTNNTDIVDNKICLLLDATFDSDQKISISAFVKKDKDIKKGYACNSLVKLLIDGHVHWIHVTDKNIKFINENDKQ